MNIGRWIRSRVSWFGWSAVGTIWFMIVYRGCDWLTSLHGVRVRLHIFWEIELPLVPAMVIVYLSLTPFLLLSGVVFAESRQWRALAVAFLAATTIAGIGFLLLPSEVGYRSTMADVPDDWKPWFQFKRLLVGQHNLCPSLHVAFTWLLAAAVSPCLAPTMRYFMMLWAGAIIVSTLFVHEHHLIDVFAGVLLGQLCFKCVYQRLLNVQRSTVPVVESNR